MTPTSLRDVSPDELRRRVADRASDADRARAELLRRFVTAIRV